MLVELGGDGGDFLQRVGRQLGEARRVGIDQPRRTCESRRRLFRRRGKALRAAGQPLVDSRQVAGRRVDQRAELGARIGEFPDQAVHALGERGTRAFDRRQRFGGAVRQRIHQRFVLRAQPLGSLLRRLLQALLQLAAALRQTFGQRPSAFVENAADFGRPLGQHRVQLTRVGADCARRLVGALADMLADRGERLGDHVGARHELCFRLVDLLAELLTHGLGAVGEPVLDIGDMSADPRGGGFGAGRQSDFGIRDVLAHPGGDRLGALRQLLVGAGERFLDSPGARVQFLRGLQRASDDALFGVREGVGDACSMLANGGRAVVDPDRKLLVGIGEDAADLERAPGQRFGGFRYAGG